MNSEHDKSRMKVHFHSDCPIFSGSENMLGYFFNDENFRDKFDVSFSFNDTPPYTKELHQRLNRELRLYPMHFIDLHNRGVLPNWIPSKLKTLILRPSRLVFGGFFFSRDVFVIYRLLKKIAPDVLHINNGGYPGAMSPRAAAVAGRIAGIKTILFVVNNMAIPYSVFWRWKQYFSDQLVKRCVTYFITGSKVALHKLRDVLQLPDHKLVSIYNGVPLSKSVTDETKARVREKFGLLNSDGIVFGIVGLLIERKGHIYLFEAVNKLIHAFPDYATLFKVLVIGYGENQEVLEKYVTTHDLGDNILFVGNQQDYNYFLSPIDVLVLPSIYNEDFPFVNIEAMSLGKPIISTTIAGIPEQVDDKVTGFLVPPGDSDSLMEALVAFLENPQLVREMGDKGLAKFNEKFIISSSIRRYIDLYTQGESISKE